MSTAGGNKDQQVFTSQIIAQTSGDAVAELINVIARQADEHGVALYLVGGPVRDLLLGRAISDIDFVIEGDAIAFAGDLSRSYGGTIQAHRPFGTAKWRLDARAAAKLSLSHAVIPDHIDLAMARSEHYAHPTALPLVSPAKIDQDLFRRDFSINALAIQLSPLQEFGRLLDPYEGHPDLRGGLIRVLHDASFIDDPTRILRATRFARRLGFEVEAHTADLMRAALPMLGRVTGPRLRNEIDMILLEAHPGDVLLRLRELGALKRIHSAFRVSKRLPALLESCLQDSPPWHDRVDNLPSLRWSLLLGDIQEAEARAVAERLNLTQALTKTIVASVKLRERATAIVDPGLRPSAAARLLDPLPVDALHTDWLLFAGNPTLRNVLATYMTRWRLLRPTIGGEDLKALGLRPGPRYKQILDGLRFAWIDGEINSAAGERALLEKWLTDEDLS